MANNEHLERLKQGVNAWNLWREVHPTLLPDLKEVGLGGADLPGMNLCNAHFERAYLFGADLRHADLRGANFSQAYLSTANLREVGRRGVYLHRAASVRRYFVWQTSAGQIFFSHSLLRQI